MIIIMDSHWCSNTIFGTHMLGFFQIACLQNSYFHKKVRIKDMMNGIQ